MRAGIAGALTVLVVLGCGEAEAPARLEDDRDFAMFTEIESSRRELTAAELAGLRGLQERFPDSRRVRTRLEQEYLRRENYQLFSELLLAREAALEPQERVLLVQALTSAKRFAAAYERAIALLAARPRDPELSWLAGYNAFHLGRHPEAAGHFDEAWEGILQRGYADVLALRALLHLYAGELDEALERAREAVAAQPTQLVASHALGSVLTARGEEAAAEAEFARMQQIQDAGEAERRRAATLASAQRDVQRTWSAGDMRGCEEAIQRGLDVARGRDRIVLLEYLVEVLVRTGREPSAQRVREQIEALRASGGGQR